MTGDGKLAALAEVADLYAEEQRLLGKLEQTRRRLPLCLADAAREGATKAELRDQVGGVTRQAFQKRYGAELEQLVPEWKQLR